MNKVLSISLAALLVISVIGVTVNTHYCHGAARYSVIATDSDHSSCCGDEMDACPSCEDRISSNVMDAQSVISLAAEQSVLDAMDIIFAHADASTPDQSDEHSVVRACSKSPPGNFTGMTLPVLFQSFLN